MEREGKVDGLAKWSLFLFACNIKVCMYPLFLSCVCCHDRVRVVTRKVVLKWREQKPPCRIRFVDLAPTFACSIQNFQPNFYSLTRRIDRAVPKNTTDE